MLSSNGFAVLEGLEEDGVSSQDQENFDANVE